MNWQKVFWGWELKKFLQLLSDPSNILIVYGSLAPEQSNHHIVKDIAGKWRKGMINGKLVKITTGAYKGYLAYVREDDQVEEIKVDILFSKELVSHWKRLDEFEGEGYVRALAKFQLDNGETGKGYLYELNKCFS